MGEAKEVVKEASTRVAEKGITGGLVVIGVVGGVYLLYKYLTAIPKTPFNPTPEPWEDIPIQPPIIPPIIKPPPINPSPPVRLSDINLLSGACTLLQYNILQDLEMCTPGKIWWVMPKYVEPEPQRYVNCAKRIRAYFKNSLKGTPGVFGCDLVWQDVVLFLEYLAENPTSKLHADVVKTARKVYPEVRRIPL